MSNAQQLAAATVIATLTGCSYVPPDTPDPGRRLVLAEQGYFFVGGHYAKSKDRQIRVGQMYVEYQIPENRTQPYPIVMWHGGNQTGTNFLGTPDGRTGWGDYFLQRGYAVHIVDQPGRARSGYFTDVYGPVSPIVTDGNRFDALNHHCVLRGFLTRSRPTWAEPTTSATAGTARPLSDSRIVLP